jgi:hypothetical protein
MPQLANRRHEAFAINLASGAPLRTSFISAGYKDSYSAPYNASRLRNSPKVRERVNELLLEFGKDSFVHLTWIQERLVAIIDGKEPGKVRIDADGKRVEEVDRIAALAALARSIGAGGDGTTVNVAAMAAAGVEITDADRQKALAALFAKFKARAEDADGKPIPVAPTNMLDTIASRVADLDDGQLELLELKIAERQAAR